METLELLEKIHREESLVVFFHRLYKKGAFCDRVRLWYVTIILIISFIWSACTGVESAVFIPFFWSMIVVYEFFGKLRSDYKDLYTMYEKRIKRYKEYHQYPRYVNFRNKVIGHCLKRQDIRRSVEYLDIELRSGKRYSILSQPFVSLVISGCIGVFSSIIATQEGVLQGIGVFIFSFTVIWVILSFLPEKIKADKNAELFRFLSWYLLDDSVDVGKK